MAAERPSCAATVYDSRARGYPCSRYGKVERDGKWYCAQHDPEAVAAKRSAQDAQWAADRTRRDAIGARLDGLAERLSVHASERVTVEWNRLEPIGVRLSESAAIRLLAQLESD